MPYLVDPFKIALVRDRSRSEVYQADWNDGLDNAFILQYLNYLGDLYFCVMFGKSFSTQQGLGELLRLFPAHIRLGLWALIFLEL